MSRVRLDQLLVARGLSESRAKARAAIEAGGVTVDGQPARAPSQQVDEAAELTAVDAFRWVGRGALKLDHALTNWPIEVAGRRVLDVGASTGGFTEVCLERGAAKIFAVDVGFGQMHPRIAGDPRVVSLERTDARDLDEGRIPEPPQLIVCDVSFIGLAKALPAALGVALGSYIAYVAPAAVFKTAFILFALFMSARFLFGRDDWRVADRLPGTPLMAAAGFSFGALATLVGVAGGSFSTLFLTLYGTAFHTAVATSAGLGAIVGVPASVGYMLAGWQHMDALPPLSIGFVSILGVLLIAPASVLAAPYGAWLAHRLSRRRLEVAFGLFLLFIALRFAAILVLQ